MEMALSEMRKTYADFLVFEKISDFKISTKMLNEYQKSERKTQQNLFEVISKQDFAVSQSEILEEKSIEQKINSLFTGIAKTFYEIDLIEIQKKSFELSMDFIEKNVLKDNILIFDYSNSHKKFFS